ncbi:MAG: transposase [Clostridiaceae bacterium]
MSFKENSCNQISFIDSFSGLTTREQKALEKSWAKVFADEIFPAIDEKRFSVLYSDKASRPNAPVNVTVGALIIKELFDYSDDEIVENLMLDLHLQYALHTTSFEEQPLSDKSLSRFRKRCYDYEKLYNVDLYHDCVKDLSNKIAKLMNVSGRVRRMDSMMIESNIRKLSRMELLYTCIAKLVVYLHENQPDIVPEELTHYCDPNDFNRVIYHQRSTDSESRIQILLYDADKLIDICSTGFENITEYELFIRCISEQTIVEDGKRRLLTKEDGTMNASALQNPSDPDATFRKKANMEHRGYVANMEESVGENGSVITNYQYEQNIYSDSQFLKDHLNEMGKQDETVILVTDGAYTGAENHNLAKERNVELITTSLAGRTTADIMAEFEFNEEGTKVICCPAGHKPRSCTYMKTSGQCNASFDRNLCSNCPYQNQCKPKFYKKVSRIITSKVASERAKMQRKMQGEEFNNYARFRNGVETLPSILRRNYHLNKMPRGKQRGKLFFGCKIAAINFKKLFNFRKCLGNYAPNPVIA